MLRENSQRLRSQQSTYFATSPTNCYNWCDEYFPHTDQAFKKISKQTQSKKVQCDIQQIQELAKMYKTQNQEIQERNKQLLGKVRYYKQKQQSLLLEIAELEEHYKKLSKEVEVENYANNKQNKYQQFNVCKQSQVLNYNFTQHFKNNFINMCNSDQEILLPQNNQKQSNIKDLNDQFCKLVQQSISEKNPGKRKQLRKQLAQLASQMKKVRNSDINIDTKSMYKVQKPSKTIRNSDIVMESPTSKALAPYLENKTSMQTNNDDKLTHSLHQKILRKPKHSHSNSDVLFGQNICPTGGNFKKF